MMDADDKFLEDLHAKGKDEGLKILDTGITVTTPQGTVPLKDYGSFQPQFEPQFNRGEIMGWNMVGSTGNGDKILGEWNPEHKGSLTSLCRDLSAKALKNEQMHPNELSVEFSATAQTGPEVDQFAKKFHFHEFTEEEKQAWADQSKESDRAFVEEMKNAFHVPQAYIDSMSQYDPETKEVIVQKPRAIGKSMPFTLGQTAGRKRAVMQTLKQQKYKSPLPSLKAINANIADAWGQYVTFQQERKNVIKRHLAELKRMSDHELRVYINLARMRANTISGGKKFPSQLDMEKYVMALEEQDDRRREHYNKL